jgi:hypothetical protein
LHRDFCGLWPEADRLVWEHEVHAGRGIDQEVSGTVTRKADDEMAFLLERKPRLERGVTGFTCATDEWGLGVRSLPAQSYPGRSFLAAPGRSRRSSKR